MSRQHLPHFAGPWPASFFLSAVLLKAGALALLARQSRREHKWGSHLEELSTLPGKSMTGRMWHALGKDSGRYLHARPANVIGDHIRKCQSCDTLDECDVFLEENNRSSKAERDFCPNAEDFDALRDELTSATAKDR